jgi:hypothetical protein
MTNQVAYTIISATQPVTVCSQCAADAINPDVPFAQQARATTRGPKWSCPICAGTDENP